MSDTATPKAKDKALSHGAHEIRNSAAVIIGYLRMLTSDRMGAITEPQRRVLNEISKSAAKLSPSRMMTHEPLSAGARPRPAR